MVHIVADEGTDSKSRKNNACAREQPFHRFVDSKRSKILAVQVYRIRVSSPEEIVKRAREYAQKQYGLGEYNSMSNNCQNLASLCVCEKSISKVPDHLIRLFCPVTSKFPKVVLAGIPIVLVQGPIRTDIRCTRVFNCNLIRNVL